MPDFHAHPRLGGVSTLRNFNEGRFYENDTILPNPEERIRTLSVELFGIPGEARFAPFFDAGKVLESSDEGVLMVFSFRLHLAMPVFEVRMAVASPL